MPRKRLSQELFVYMNGLAVGKLTRLANGILEFRYEHSWLADQTSQAISLSMPLTELPYKGDVVTNYFDNLLPDSEVIRNRIQARFNSPSKNCFDLLAHIGADCVGALQLLTQPTPTKINKIQAEPITNKAIAKLLQSYKTAPLGMAEDFDFRISIAGAQEKTALLWYQNQWQIPKVNTATSHIIKLPIGLIEHAGIDLSDSIENEWLCLKILEAYGLPVAKAEITLFNNSKTLVVERFDRSWVDNGTWLQRLPQEDLCQALDISPGLKYESDGGPGIENIMQVLRGSQTAKTDRNIFMKIVLLFWIMGAIDGHAKNFSISLLPGGRYRLTPVYDVMSAYPIIAKHQLQSKQIKMAMSVKDKNRHYHWHNILPRHWISTAERCQFPIQEMQAIMEEVIDSTENVIAIVSQSLQPKFPHNITEPIFTGMRHIVDRIKRYGTKT